MSAPPSRRRVVADARGRQGEWQAEAWCTQRGWEILARRVRTPAGEVDLIARDGTTVVCVEVKWRRSAPALDDAIDARRLARVAAAAEILAAEHCGPGDSLRVDVLLLAPGVPPRHIENAWIG